MNVCIRRFTLCHLYGCDAQGPDVSYTVVADLLNYLGCHPEWSTDHSVSLCHGVLQSGNIYITPRLLEHDRTKRELLRSKLQTVSCWQTLLHLITTDICCNFTVSCPATPKSASLACPSVLRRMFPALMSRWIFLMK